MKTIILNLLKQRLSLPLWAVLSASILVITQFYVQYQNWKQAIITNAKQEVINHTIQQNNNQIKTLNNQTKILYDSVAYYKVLAQKASEYQIIDSVSRMSTTQQIQYLRARYPQYFDPQ